MSTHSTNNPPLRVAVAGLGTVGCGVLRLLRDNGPLIATRAGRDMRVVAVSARDRSRDRGLDLSSCAWVEDPVALADRADVDVVIELMGGAQGPAYALVERALSRGLPVVTANKALLATHGAHLAMLAEQNHAPLLWEAAVAGGIPIIKTLREGLCGNRIKAIAGILNGTCNYILTRMEAEGTEFGDVLADAQSLGYAEADPGFDIDGIDAAHKLALLGALAFGGTPDIKTLPISGIRAITARDIRFAGELGYAIRLLGVAHKAQEDALTIVGGVEACLIPKGHPLTQAPGPYNAILTRADPIGAIFLAGPGAGAGATASAIVADIIDIARSDSTAQTPVFGVPAQTLAVMPWQEVGATRAPFYLRLTVTDAPGVIASLAAILRDEAISIQSFLQHGRDPGGAVSLVLTTHEASRCAMTRATLALCDLSCVLAKPQVLRIVEDV